mmetsp:Transcript_5812/g.8544  ORF Transcript_5812/g.8544 Transcript_5812/m.8544 type:complete len:206 (-) Transcript_5812:7-624(-)
MSNESSFLDATVPTGFHAAIEAWNQLPLDILSHMSHKTARFVLQEGLPVDCDHVFDSMLSSSDRSKLTHSQLLNILHAHTFIFQLSFVKRIDPTLFAQTIVRSTQLTKDRVRILHSDYSSILFNSSSSSPPSSSIVQIGSKLHHLDYRVSISVSSNDCDALHDLLIKVHFIMADPSQSKLFELSYPQFLALKKQFEDMQQLLKTL